MSTDRTYPSYSPFFSTIYDEQSPVGNLGRGTHYSVLRCAEWFDVTRKQLEIAQVHDFAVIWDEDHDTRIINVIERIYMAGLLSPVQFIGERKGSLTAIVAAKFYFQGKKKQIENYDYHINQITRWSFQDSWPAEIGSFDRVELGEAQCIVAGIISAEPHRVLTYLKNIDSLWSLGTKPYQFPQSPKGAEESKLSALISESKTSQQ